MKPVRMLMGKMSMSHSPLLSPSCVQLVLQQQLCHISDPLGATLAHQITAQLLILQKSHNSQAQRTKDLPHQTGQKVFPAYPFCLH